MGHHVHRDIPILIAFATLSTTLSLFIASLALNWAIRYFGFAGPADVAAFPALGLIFGALTGFLGQVLTGMEPTPEERARIEASYAKLKADRT